MTCYELRGGKRSGCALCFHDRMEEQPETAKGSRTGVSHLSIGALNSWTRSWCRAAGELHVENNGVDRSSCGDKRNPCRSISQAIANADAGDRILVGPGRYGDLNQNGVLGEPGEEAGDVGGCQCMINVNKQVTILSTDGAEATVLDAGLVGGLVAVRIVADGVVFGHQERGFTLFAPDRNVALGVGAKRVAVTGNIASRGAGGFSIFGSNNVITGNIAVATTGVGFTIQGPGHTVHGNASIGNGDGFAVVLSSDVHLTDNVSTGNIFGYSLFGDADLDHNSAIGNSSAGIHVEQDANTVRISRSNIFGNGESNQVLALGIPRANCGVVNRSGQPITATNNFWGAASGPGPNPADEICDVGSSTTIFAPFAKTEFRVNLK